MEQTIGKPFAVLGFFGVHSLAEIIYVTDAAQRNAERTRVRTLIERLSPIPLK